MKDLFITHCFSTPIANTKFSFNCSYLAHLAYRIKELNPTGRNISNRSGWQSLNLELFDKELKSFELELTKTINVYWKNACNGKNILTLDNMWFNINPTSSYNVLHLHPNCKVSGAYYVQVPKDSGRIVFEHPVSSFEYDWTDKDFISESPITCSRWAYEPEENLCMFFPSWIKHEVETNKSNRDRISISFNYS